MELNRTITHATREHYGAAMLLISNSLQPPSEYFEGYCFRGADFISGNSGAEEYEKATGNRLTPGNDGCYVIVRNSPQGVEIGTDGRGSMKLFLFQRNNRWAISTSLTVLVDYLRARGVLIEPRPDILKALKLPGSFTQQLITTQTAFSDIQLVPSFEKLTINRGRIDTSRAYEPAPSFSYTEALGQHVSTWLARIRTVTSDPETVMTADLSGGRDSRACFAFAQASGLLQTNGERFKLASNARLKDDFSAATRIANTYGQELNTSIRPPTFRGSAERGIRRWHEQSMGVYLPVYLHAAARDPRRLHLHGAGGGNFRPLYEATTLAGKLDPSAKHMGSADFDALKSTAVANMESLKTKRPEIPELSLHYREYRNRFHFGFSPQCNTVITPLNSILLDAVTDRDNVDANQVYADIMDTLVPGLKNLPYDDVSKMPSNPEVSAEARAAQDMEVPVGSTYIGGPMEDGYTPGGSQFQRWLHTISPSISQLEHSEYLNHTDIEDVNSFLKMARDMPRRPRANSPEMKLLSYATAISFATT